MEKKELSFFEKVGAVQAELKAPKGQFNKFGGYAYRSCEDILEAVKPLLKKYGLVLVVGDELVEMGGRIYVKATAKLIGDGRELTNTAFAREEETKKGMDGSQITGASSSYARKYALNGLFLIDDTKDSDATNTHGKEEEEKKEVKKEVPKASEKQVSLIMTLVPEENRPKMLEYYKVKKIEDLTIEQASEIITKKSKKEEK